VTWMTWALALGLLMAAPPGPAPTGTVMIAVGGDVDSFNEYVAASTFAVDLSDQLFLSLLEEKEAEGAEPPRFGPRLARAWRVAPDGLSVTFELRDDVRWSDGRPTTSEDVVYTWRMQTDPAVAWADADLKENIASVEAAGPRAVTFKLKRRSPYALLDINEGHILPAHLFSATPVAGWRRTDFSTGLVTNGPFRLASYKPGQAVELSANPDYYERGQPGVGRVVFRIVPDPGVRLQQLLAGENDVLEAVPHEAVERIRSEPDLSLIRFDQRMYTYLCWNARRELFSDARVRRALTMALDRDEILRVLARGMGRPSAGPIVSSLWASDRDLKPLPYDAAAAKALLREAGWTDRDAAGTLVKQGVPFRFELEFNRGNTLREQIALRAAAQLAALGIAAVPRPVEWAAFQRKHREGDFDAFVGSRIVSTRVDLDGFVTGSEANYSGYSNRQVDELVRAAAAAGTLEAARPSWVKAQALIARDQPCTFLFEQDRLYAVRGRIRDVAVGALGLYGGLRRWRVEAPPAAAPSPRTSTPSPRWR